VNRVSTPGVLAISRTVVLLNERPHLIPTSSNYDSYLIWCCGICLVDSAVVFVHFCTGSTDGPFFLGKTTGNNFSSLDGIGL
jgi:hypothetical protein